MILLTKTKMQTLVDEKSKHHAVRLTTVHTDARTHTTQRAFDELYTLSSAS